MGKASSNKKVARAARAAGRPGAKKSYAWPMAIGAVVILGVALIILSFSGEDAEASGPRVGQHWHAAYGIYDCDTYLGPLGDTRGDEFGIHTHQDYLMHMHPISSRVTGENANIEVFANEVGLELSDTSIKGSGIDKSNGDECGDEKGTLKLLVWDDPSQAEPEVITEDSANHAPADSSIWVLAFTAEGTEVPLPPGAINLGDPTAAEEGRQPATATSLPAGETPIVPPEGTDTTVAPPAEGESPTESTAPPDDSTDTTAAP